jgi:PKD repeat protein
MGWWIRSGVVAALAGLVLYAGACADKGPAQLGVEIEALLGGNPTEPLEVTFSADIAPIPETLADVSFEWDLGDGATSSQAVPVHVYSQEGSYEVTLTVRIGDRTGFDSHNLNLEVGVDLQVTSVNSGTKASGDTHVDLFLLAEESWPENWPDVSEPPQAQILSPGLNGGESALKAAGFAIPDVAPGFYYLYAYIDGPDDQAVAEFNEENNVGRMTAAVEVLEGPPPTPEPSPTVTPGPSPTVTPTSSPQPSPTTTVSPGPTPTATTPQPSPTMTTPEPSPTGSPDPTPTGSGTPSPTPEPSPTGSTTPTTSPTIIITVIPMETPEP